MRAKATYQRLHSMQSWFILQGALEESSARKSVVFLCLNPIGRQARIHQRPDSKYHKHQRESMGACGPCRRSWRRGLWMRAIESRKDLFPELCA